MNYQTIADVYAANDRIRENLKKVLADVSDETANLLPEGEKWTVAALVEHIALAGHGMTQISLKLLSAAQAESESSDGKLHITEQFAGKISGVDGQKFEAPEMVRPTGTKSIAESLKKLDDTRQKLNELRPMFDAVGCGNFTFPHPAFGEINAHEWLTLLGGHESRHTDQIVKLLEKIA